MNLPANIAAIVLDLDGVILRTTSVKHKAMLSLFDKHPEKRDAISHAILEDGGIPRREKLDGLMRKYLDMPVTDALLSQYLHRYAVRLEHELMAAPLINGMAYFLSQMKLPLYVSSSAPEAEISEQLSRRGLKERFSGFFGAGTPKSKALLTVASLHPSGPIVFFGDARSDLLAAKAAGAAFVGIVAELDCFQDLPIVKISSFANVAEVEHAVRQAAGKLPERFYQSLSGSTLSL